ncbi:MAG: ABC transporter substrate-binding protein [Bacteroidales bacterium]|nr:ABC transporter substrate-binding protein [Bacteroidales bacterium]
MKRKLIILSLLVGLFLVLPMVAQAQVVIERSTEIVSISGKQYYMHHVKRGETLYSLSKTYHVTEAEIIRLNPEINDLGLQADMVIGIPVVIVDEPQPEKPSLSALPISEDDEVGDGYIIHTAKEIWKTKRFVSEWGIDEDEFRMLNPSVGSRIFEGQKVLIPMPGVHAGDTLIPVSPISVVEEDTVIAENPDTRPFVLPSEMPLECYASSANANKTYRVALLVPLYLSDIEKLDLSKERIEKTKSARVLKFLQFYEGFMMAADSLTEYYGMRLELTVIDVNENVAGAQEAVNQLRSEPVDLIVGPFFSRSFAVVQEYAQQHNIMIVNPMSERESILAGAPNVLKLKPSAQAMATELADMIKMHYPKAKVTLLVENSLGDSAVVNAIERALREAVAPEVQLSNAEMLEMIGKESRRRNMGKKMLSTLEVEGQIFSTRVLEENPNGVIYFNNPMLRLSSSESDISTFKNGLSSARDNVLIAYGSDIVFATTILNNVNKSAQKYPITLVGLPNWTEHDNLLVENLLNMNAIYFDDHFVNYNDSVVMDFVDSFREKYDCDPLPYAFEGFDVGWYFMNALMRYGSHALDCLPYYHLPLLSTRYYFGKSRNNDGLENRYWNIYQYDNQLIELKPIMIHSEEEE